MKEGEPELGGLQVPHRDADASTSTPGPQPDPFATLNPRSLQSQSSPQIPVSPAPQPPIPQTPAPQAPSQSLARPIAQPTSSASAPVISTSSPVVAPTPTPRQFPTQSISSGTGDILLSPAPAKKSKKWPIVVAVFTVLVLFISLSIWIFTGANIVGNDTKVKELYNQYANYILFGETSTNGIGDFDPNDTFFIDENYENEEFLTNAQNLFNEFYEKFADSNLTETTVVSIQSTKEHYEFLAQKLNVTSIDEEFFQIYLESGKDAAIEYINNFYDFSDGESYLIELFKNLNKEYALAELFEWEIYDNAGCRADAQYDPVCIAEIPYDVLTGPATQLGELESSINGLATSSVDWIKDQCLEINLSLEGIVSNMEEKYVEDKEIDGEIDEE